MPFAYLPSFAVQTWAHAELLPLGLPPSHEKHHKCIFDTSHCRPPHSYCSISHDFLVLLLVSCSVQCGLDRLWIAQEIAGKRKGTKKCPRECRRVHFLNWFCICDSTDRHKHPHVLLNKARGCAQENAPEIAREIHQRKPHVTRTCESAQMRKLA